MRFLFAVGLRHGLEADDGGDKGEDEKQAPERGRLVEKQDADCHGAYGADAGPHGVGCAYRQALRGFRQQTHAHHCKKKKTGHPAPPGKAFYRFCPPEAIGEPHLAAAGNNKNYPVHCGIRACRGLQEFSATPSKAAQNYELFPKEQQRGAVKPAAVILWRLHILANVLKCVKFKGGG